MDRHKHYVMFYINQSNAKSKINFGDGAYDTSPNPPDSVRPEATTLSLKKNTNQKTN